MVSYFSTTFCNSRLQLDLDKPYDAGRIDVGLCISQVKTFVGHFNVTAAAVKVVGVDKVESAVTDLVNLLVSSYNTSNA